MDESTSLIIQSHKCPDTSLFALNRALQKIIESQVLRPIDDHQCIDRYGQRSLIDQDRGEIGDLEQFGAVRRAEKAAVTYAADATDASVEAESMAVRFHKWPNCLNTTFFFQQLPTPDPTRAALNFRWDVGAAVDRLDFHTHQSDR